MSLSDEEFKRLKGLWAEAYLKLSEMGQIIGKHTESFPANLSVKEIEFKAVKRDKKGKIIDTQIIKFGGDGRVKEKKEE